jgi:hypothetical protein
MKTGRQNLEKHLDTYKNVILQKRHWDAGNTVSVWELARLMRKDIKKICNLTEEEWRQYYATYRRVSYRRDEDKDDLDLTSWFLVPILAFILYSQHSEAKQLEDFEPYQPPEMTYAFDRASGFYYVKNIHERLLEQSCYAFPQEDESVKHLVLTQPREEGEGYEGVMYHVSKSRYKNKLHFDPMTPTHIIIDGYYTEKEWNSIWKLQDILKQDRTEINKVCDSIRNGEVTVRFE